VLLVLKLIDTVGSQLSVAVGVPGAGTAVHCTVVFAGTNVKTGAVLSTTVIVCDAVEELLHASMAFQVRVNV
jgi:hypothetical protein